MKKRILAAGAISVAGVVAAATPASAFYCTVANKPAGAGSIEESELRFTRTGNWIAPGGFVTFGGTDYFIRGGAGDKGTGNASQFGAATENAINNGPADHGVIEP